jgi:hypothetical protein
VAVACVSVRVVRAGSLPLRVGSAWSGWAGEVGEHAEFGVGAAQPGRAESAPGYVLALCVKPGGGGFGVCQAAGQPRAPAAGRAGRLPGWLPTAAAGAQPSRGDFAYARSRLSVQTNGISGNARTGLSVQPAGAAGRAISGA